MNEHPIIMSSDMVLAILDSQKTQTRRIIKPQVPGLYNVCRAIKNEAGEFLSWCFEKSGDPDFHAYRRCPYGKVGDRLYVRENWWAVEVDQIGVQYCVFDDEFTGEDELGGSAPNPPELRLLKRQNWRWGRHPNIHLPKEHTRIWLEITGIRVERVCKISEGDSRAEGVKPYPDDIPITLQGIGQGCEGYMAEIGKLTKYKLAFCDLWDSLNAKRGYGWEKNPWVWAIEFKRVQEMPDGK